VEGDVGVGDAGHGQGVQGHSQIVTLAPAVAQGQTQSQGLTGVDDAVAVVDGIVIQIEALGVTSVTFDSKNVWDLFE
jgi:hypothetical protein